MLCLVSWPPHARHGPPTQVPFFPRYISVSDPRQGFAVATTLDMQVLPLCTGSLLLCIAEIGSSLTASVYLSRTYGFSCLVCTNHPISKMLFLP